jgi:hypothetical protein
MNRRNILNLSAITALALVLVPGSAVSQQESIRGQLIGIWTLVSLGATAPDGTRQLFYGPNPRGILILDAGGRYAAVSGRPDRPKFKDSANLRMDTPAAEYGEAARAYAGYFGTWTVDEADKTITMQLESSLIPNAEGKELKWSLSLSGDELTLTEVSVTVFAGGRTQSAYRRAK